MTLLQSASTLQWVTSTGGNVHAGMAGPASAGSGRSQWAGRGGVPLRARHVPFAQKSGSQATSQSSAHGRHEPVPAHELPAAHELDEGDGVTLPTGATAPVDEGAAAPASAMGSAPTLGATAPPQACAAKAKTKKEVLDMPASEHPPCHTRHRGSPARGRAFRAGALCRHVPRLVVRALICRFSPPIARLPPRRRCFRAPPPATVRQFPGGLLCTASSLPRCSLSRR